MQDDEQNNFSTLRENLNHTSVEILLTDSRVALTFISVAETAESRETAERNIHNARKAYDSIQNTCVKYVFTDSQTAVLDSNLGKARARLEALGQKF